MHGEVCIADWYEIFRGRFRKWDALEYYEVSDTWRRGDCSLNDRFHGNLRAALGSIRAKMWILPGTTDQVRMLSVTRDTFRGCAWVSRPSVSRLFLRAVFFLMCMLHAQYFRKEEIELEAAMVEGATFRPLESCLGHMAEFDESCQPTIKGAIAEALVCAGVRP